ncbi:MAG: hypothetical protein HOE54_13115, partial [Gammaproteobacteria bacterium]|nr:hypothetical protein [Gammaproteobacteria bacterium]
WNPPTASTGSIITGTTFVNSLGLGSDITNWLKGKLSLGGIELGGKATASSWGRVAFDIRFQNMTQGQVDVGYPIDVNIQVPKANTFRGGDTVIIRTSFDETDDWYMSTGPERGEFSVGNNLGLRTKASVKVCADDCTSETLFDINKSDNHETMLTLASDFENTSVPSVPLCDPFNDSSDYATWTVTFCESFFHGIRGFSGFPHLSTGDATKLANGSLVDHDGTRFSDLNFDIDFWLKYAGVPLPLGVQSPWIGPVQVGYETIDYAFNFDIDQTRDVRFDPRPEVTLSLGAVYDYQILSADESQVLSSGTSNTVTLDVGNHLAVEVPDGTVTETPVDHNYELRNTLTHEGEMIYQGDYTNTVLQLNFNTPSFEIYGGSTTCIAGYYEPYCKKKEEVCDPTGVFGCTDVCVDWDTRWVCSLEVTIPEITYPGSSINLGPLAVASIPFPSTTVDVFPKIESEIDGFDTYAGNTLSLDPENPVLAVAKETANIVNNGGGTHTVNYIMHVSNLGDVPMESQVVDDLVQTFAESTSFEVSRVQSCSADILNDGYDGEVDTDLLATPTLEVGEAWLVNLEVVVDPGAYPDVTVNQAVLSGYSHPRGTLVEETSEDATYLGPLAVAELGDFVLYANSVVSLRDLANSSGHIGSNDVIEIKSSQCATGGSDGGKGKSKGKGKANSNPVPCDFDGGILAGDLHAVGYIQSNDTFVSDYVFTDQFVLENGGGIIQEVYGRLVSGDYTGDKANFKPGVIPLPSLAFSAGGADISVSESTVLAPGTYGDVKVNKGQVLELSSGTYFIERLFVHDGGEVRILLSEVDGKAIPMNLNIVSDATIKKDASFTLESAVGSSRDVRLNAMSGGVMLHERSSFTGVITSPSGHVTMKEGTSLKGAIYANSITISGGARVDYHTTFTGDLYKLVDLDCDGVPDLKP